MVFQSRDDAQQAIKRYNQVALDGKPMDIKLAKPGISGRVLSSGIKCVSPVHPHPSCLMCASCIMQSAACLAV